MVKVIASLIFHHLVDLIVLVPPIQLVLLSDLGIIVKQPVPLLTISLLAVKSILLLLITDHQLKFLVVGVLDLLDNLELTILLETEVDLVDEFVVLLDGVLHLIHLVLDSVHLILSVLIFDSVLDLPVLLLDIVGVSLPVLRHWRIGVGVR